MWPNRVRKRAIESAIRFNHAVRLSPRPYVKLTNSELIVQKKRLAPRGTGYREADATFQRAADREKTQLRFVQSRHEVDARLVQVVA